MALLRFRFRSGSRDQKSDSARISSVRTAIQLSIKSAESELAGLSRRLQQAMAEAAAAYESADEEYSARDSAQEKCIAAAESRLVAAQQRSTSLGQHITKLRELEELLTSKFREDAAQLPPSERDPPPGL
jgi:aspartate oxidase